MSLIDNLNIHEGLFGHSRGFDESKWTQELLKAGYAVLAESDPHQKIRAAEVHAGEGDESVSSPDTPGAGAVPVPEPGRPTPASKSSRRNITDPDRLLSLKDMALRMTGKTRKR